MIKEDDENEEDLLVNACLMVEDTNELSESNSNKCELCHQFMPSQDLRSLHYVLNHGCKICSVCSQVSITLNSFKIHVRSNHSQFLCDLCDIVFSTHGELLKHRNNFHLLFKCPLCIFEFFSESHVESHLVKFHRICVPNFLSVNNYVSEWYDSNETYHCNMCGAKKCKVDVFSHFIQHHQISLLPLAQKFMSQNLNIRVIGVDSEVDSQANPDVTICKGCSGHVSEEVPLSAHNFICLGEVMCKICLQPQSNPFTRNSHINEEHINYPCSLGCSDTIVFDNEQKLHDHCRTVHNVKPCHLCRCFVSCAEGLMKQHLQMCHSYYRSDEISPSDSLFNVHCGNTTIGLICSLCDFDAVIQISSVEDLFKHLNYHSVSLGAVSHFLEKDNLHESLHLRLSGLRNIEKYFQKSASDTNGSQQNDNNSFHGSYPEDNTPSSGKTEIIFLSNSESECSRTKNSQEDYSQSDESKIHSVEEPITVIGSSSNHTQSNGFEIKNPNNPVKNVADIVNTPETEKGSICLELVGEDPDTSKTESLARCLENDKTLKLKDEVNTLEYEQEGDEMESSTGDINSNKKVTNYVNEADMNIELVGIGIGNKNASSDDAEMMADNCDDMKLKLNMELVGRPNGNANNVNNGEMLEGDYDGNDDRPIEWNMELVGNANANDDAEMLDDYYDPDDDVELQNASAVFQKKVRLALLNVKPDVNPREVECVVTDTSDIEESESEDGGARRTKSTKSRSLPGLNRIGQKGFRCEICRGKFKCDEGMRELVKHMRCLHGFSCNLTGAQRNAAFTFNKGKPGQRLRMQPGLVCPVCSKGWNSKRLLRKHYSTVHGQDLAKDATPGPLSYKCRFCEQTFWEAIECFTHEKEEHPEQKPFKCHICGHAQLRKVMLNRHLKLAHPSEKLHTYLSYKCKRCLKLFASYEMLATHVHQIHPFNRIYPCAHCNRTHQNKRFLVAHMKRDHQFRPFQCRQCGEVKQSKRALSIHERMKHDSKFKFPCKCRICDKKFDSVALRDVHLKEEHTNSNEYRCEECDKVFSSRSAYYAHKRTHRLSIDAYKCQHCQRKFLRRDAYVEHLRIHTTIRHKCPHCDKQFVQRSNLIRHIRMHSGDKSYKCSHCPKTFSDKAACNLHIKVHKKEDLACPHCDKTYSRKQILNNHIKTHTGVGLVSCQICGKSFTSNYALKQHLKTHESQVVCEECGERFNNADQLNHHIESTHEPTQGFSCQLCWKTFIKESAAKNHVRSHTTRKYLMCELCEKKFTTINSLKQHLINIHKKNRYDAIFKSMLAKVSAECDELQATQKDFNDVMVRVPVSQLLKKEDVEEKKMKNSSVEDETKDSVSGSQGSVEDETKDSVSRPSKIFKSDYSDSTDSSNSTDSSDSSEYLVSTESSNSTESWNSDNASGESVEPESSASSDHEDSTPLDSDYASDSDN